jgi:hypothetical protein
MLRPVAPDLTLVIAGPAWLGRRARNSSALRSRARRRRSGKSSTRCNRGAAACVIASRYEGFGLPRDRGNGPGVPTITTTVRPSKKSPKARDCSSRRATSMLAPMQSAGAGRRRVRASLSRRGRDRAAELTWERCAHAHARRLRAGARAIVRRLTACASSSMSRRFRRARSARASTPSRWRTDFRAVPASTSLGGPRDDTDRWSEIAREPSSTARCHTAAGAARLGASPGRGARPARRRDVWHGPHYTMPLALGIPASSPSMT